MICHDDISLGLFWGLVADFIRNRVWHYCNMQDIRRGLKSVRRICKERNISGVHGPIIELLNCDENFFPTVEVTAGNRSFLTVFL